MLHTEVLLFIKSLEDLNGGTGQDLLKLRPTLLNPTELCSKPNHYPVSTLIQALLDTEGFDKTITQIKGMELAFTPHTLAAARLAVTNQNIPAEFFVLSKKGFEKSFGNDGNSTWPLLVDDINITDDSKHGSCLGMDFHIDTEEAFMPEELGLLFGRCAFVMNTDTGELYADLRKVVKFLTPVN